ncbi:uncharacterized protein LOC111901490 [Lactuca sativa]|uniref:DUF547 domain-containing protein n=1 Tax=Lactuca sativa TaxID=4236 RepID=A0A9R1V632_LACSA|nr:uncharacterized protein LOC111901490 [Lactuca sativa]KAJ0200902.1 hypothetical protein LSAT_V11C600340550 [Lactuca sativa]
MNISLKANPQSKTTSLKDSKVDMQIETQKSRKSGEGSGKATKMALQQEVEKLKKRLKHEQNVHSALERALTRPLGALPRLPPYLPPLTSELLAEVAVLEEEVVRLENQMVQFRQDLYEEAIYVSFFKRNLENLADFQENCHARDRKIETNVSTPITQKSPNPKTKRVKALLKRSLHKHISAEKCPSPQKQRFEGKGIEGGDVGKSSFHIQEKGILGDDSPNKISESFLKCLMFVFARMGSTSPLRMAEMLPSLEPCENPWAMDFKDPYCIFYEFENTDIGPYKYLYEVEATTINKNHTTISTFLAQRLKVLQEKLEFVNLTSLTHQEKLAFWINTYNSCMMNAFLDHGIPETPERIVELMQKATINVGGHLLNAFSIEHFILRLPYHANHSFKKGFKINEETARSIFGLELSEPLVTFALSCGSWSSPAVRVYSGSEVEKELEVAKRDYLQAAVGISTSKKLLSIPKLLDWYMLDFAKDMESFLDWVCLQLPSDISQVAIKCVEKTFSEPISNYVKVSAYEFRFRYLLYK